MLLVLIGERVLSKEVKDGMIVQRYGVCAECSTICEESSWQQAPLKKPGVSLHCMYSRGSQIFVERLVPIPVRLFSTADELVHKSIPIHQRM